MLRGALQDADRLLECQSLGVEKAGSHAAAVANQRGQHDCPVDALPAALLGGECRVSQDIGQLLRDGRRASRNTRHSRREIAEIAREVIAQPPQIDAGELHDARGILILG